MRARRHSVSINEFAYIGRLWWWGIRQSGGSYLLWSYLCSGGTSTTFSTTSGNPPAGLTLAGDGRITGTPTQPGSFTFTVQAIDVGPPQQTATTDITIQIQSVLQITVLPNP